MPGRSRCGICRMMGHNRRSCPSKPVETPIVSKEVDECPICYEEIGAKNFCVTACGHKFCMGCIPKHLANSNACPMCRANIVDDPITGQVSVTLAHTTALDAFRSGFGHGHEQGVEDEMERSRELLDEATNMLNEHRTEIESLTRLLIEGGLMTELGFVIGH
jgi:hypothetical protein